MDRNLLKGRDFWSVKGSSQDSWIWKNILSLREPIRLSLDNADDGNVLELSNAVIYTKRDGKMDCNVVYNVFRDHFPHQHWCSLIWTGIQSRKWGFTCWLAGLNRLPTASNCLIGGLFLTTLVNFVVIMRKMRDISGFNVTLCRRSLTWLCSGLEFLLDSILS